MVHAPPPAFLYYQIWFFPTAGVMCLVAAAAYLDWHFLLLGIAMLAVGILGMAFLAWMRERYNEWHPEDRGLTDNMGFPVPRSQLWSDAFGARAIKLVRPSFGSDS